MTKKNVETLEERLLSPKEIDAKISLLQQQKKMALCGQIKIREIVKEYDFEKFVNVFRDQMEDRLIEFFNVLKMFIPIVPNQQIPSFLPVDVKMNQSDWSIQQNQTILNLKQKQSADSLRENVVSN